MSSPAPYTGFREFKPLAKALALESCPGSSDGWDEYMARADPSFLVKRFHGKSGHRFLVDYAPRYETAVSRLGEAAIDFIELRPHLHVGRDFLVKPWITGIAQVSALRPNTPMHNEYQACVQRLRTEPMHEELRTTILDNLSHSLVAFFDTLTTKIVFNELHFAEVNSTKNSL